MLSPSKATACALYSSTPQEGNAQRCPAGPATPLSPSSGGSLCRSATARGEHRGAARFAGLTPSWPHHGSVRPGRERCRCPEAGRGVSGCVSRACMHLLPISIPRSTSHAAAPAQQHRRARLRAHISMQTMARTNMACRHSRALRHSNARGTPAAPTSSLAATSAPCCTSVCTTAACP